MVEFCEWAGVRSGILVPFEFWLVLGIGTSAGQSGGGRWKFWEMLEGKSGWRKCLYRAFGVCT